MLATLAIALILARIAFRALQGNASNSTTSTVYPTAQVTKVTAVNSQTYNICRPLRVCTTLTTIVNATGALQLKYKDSKDNMGGSVDIGGSISLEL